MSAELGPVTENLSQFKPKGWYLSGGETHLSSDGSVTVTGIGGLFSEEQA